MADFGDRLRDMAARRYDSRDTMPLADWLRLARRPDDDDQRLSDAVTAGVRQVEAAAQRAMDKYTGRAPKKE